MYLSLSFQCWCCFFSQRRGSISSAISATGRINPLVTVQVGTQVSGIIKNLHADFNSVVKKGQVIAELDPAIFIAQLDQIKARLASAIANAERAKVTLANTRKEMARANELFSKNLISQSEKDTAQTNFDSELTALNAANAKIKEEEAAERLARLNLDNIVITSPIDGIVISRNVETGQTVAASLQAPTLFTIANDLSEMVIDTNVDEADIGRIEVGQPASLTVDTYPQDPFNGMVSKIYNQPTISQNVVTYNVVINVKNPGLKLRPGMTANVTIIIGQKDSVLKIPNAALRFRPPDLKEDHEKRKGSAGDLKGSESVHPLSTIWVVEKDILSPARVKLGISDGQYSEVISGDIKEGQEIAIEINKSTVSSKRPAAFRFY
jgi:HlyD family secretion protein